MPAQDKKAGANIVLAGNPNAGKTTLFNALTRSSLKTGNFHGVTTSPSSKTVDGVTYTDVPGMYSFNGYTMEERSAADAVKSADLIINVVDCLTLESSLNLTKRMIELNPNLVVYLTKCNALKARGGRVDEEMLSRILGVPVFNCPPKQLKAKLEEGSFAVPEKDGSIKLEQAYYCGDSKLTRAEKLFFNRFFALFFFVCALTFTFFITFHPSMIGAIAKDWVEDLICVKLADWVCGLTSNDALSSFLGEGVIGGVGGVLSFIPQITLLYSALIILDESGISSALSFATDGLFEKAGLSGRAAFSLVSGFGCTAAAIATTRGYSSESARRKTIAVLPFVPCGAKMPLFLTFLAPLFSNPFPAICVLYFGGVALAVIVSALVKGESEGLISEVAPISIPRVQTIAKKLFFQVKSFIIKITTYVFAFCVISWLFSHFNFTVGYCAPQESILGFISKLIAPVFYPMGVKDWRLAYAAITGFAAKENVAATIALLIPEGVALGFAPTMAICVFFLCCPACISAFAASVKEIGFKHTIKYNALQLAFAFAASYLTYLLLWLL